MFWTMKYSPKTFKNAAKSDDFLIFYKCDVKVHNLLKSISFIIFCKQ